MIQLDGADLRRFHAGDEKIFRRIVEAHSPRLLAMLRSFVSDDDAAHDLLQDVWHRAYRKRQTFQARGTLLGWLLAVSRSVGSSAASRRALDVAGVDPDTLRAEVGAERHAESAELRRDLRAAIAALSDRERDVVVLRLLEQRSTRETAERLGIAEGTVKATLHHAVQKLKESMGAWAP